MAEIENMPLRKDLACAKSLRDAGESLVVLTQDKKNLYFLVKLESPACAEPMATAEVVVMLEKSGPAGTKGEL